MSVTSKCSDSILFEISFLFHGSSYDIIRVSLSRGGGACAISFYEILLS